jgi:hypothetical protein
MLVTEDSLPEAYSLAVQERNLGKKWIYVELETNAPIKRFVSLWESIIGEVVDRIYYNDALEGELPKLTVRGVRLRVNVIDVMEAMRRFKKRDASEISSPLAANQIAPKPTAGTAR